METLQGRDLSCTKRQRAKQGPREANNDAPTNGAIRIQSTEI
jgi:hypothetical protein